MMVQAVVVSRNNVHDSISGQVALDLITGPIANVYGDGAYDTKDMRRCIKEKGGRPVIPPREDAALHKKEPSLAERNAALVFIKDRQAAGMSLSQARKAWKIHVGYHTRSLVECHMYRFKNAFSERLQSRKLETQTTEVFLKTKLLNQFTHIGMPDIRCVA